MVKAVRGAVQIPEDDKEAIIQGVQKVVLGVMEINNIKETDIISLQFTVTGDLKSLNPAAALRGHGFSEVPLFCSQEPECENGLVRAIRILLTCSHPGENRLKPIYLDGAEVLRPDLNLNGKL